MVPQSCIYHYPAGKKVITAILSTRTKDFLVVYKPDMAYPTIMEFSKNHPNNVNKMDKMLKNNYCTSCKSYGENCYSSQLLS